MEALRRNIQPAVRPRDNPLGALRVLAPEGALPQAADRLEPGLPLYADETLLRVSRLHLDSASFRQLRESCGEDPRAIAAQILRIVRERGKMQNPVTGSGGMLLGEVVELGPRAPTRFHPGDRVASLVSLTLTPLRLERILQVQLDTGQIEVEGHAVLFASSPAVRMPADLTEPTALAALDVCGAPAWVRRLVAPGNRVLILGAGKSGVLCAYAAAQTLAPAFRADGPGEISQDPSARSSDEKRGATPAQGEDFASASLWATDVSERALERAAASGVFARTLRADAQRPLDFLEALRGARAPDFDLVVNACNAPETETAAILAARPGGKVLFFNMATQFSRVVLSAEGLGRDVELIMGNGYAEGHAEYALDLLRRHAALREFFGG